MEERLLWHRTLKNEVSGDADALSLPSGTEDFSSDILSNGNSIGGGENHFEKLKTWLGVSEERKE